MIDRDHALPITRQAHLLGMSRGAVYYLPRPTRAADLALMRRIDELHLESPFMGARQLRRQLQREGVQVGRRHIGTLMLCAYSTPSRTPFRSDGGQHSAVMADTVPR
jgi:putative transposase